MDKFHVYTAGSKQLDYQKTTDERCSELSLHFILLFYFLNLQQLHP